MPSLETILLVVVAGFALSASPGPSMLYVLSRSVGQNTTAGLASAAGLAVGGVMHAIAAAVGLSALLAYSPAIYRLLTIAGAIYLIYLGVQMFRCRKQAIADASQVTQQPLASVFYQGVLVEVLNPKTALFFVAFLPQFVRYDTGAAGTVMLQIFVLGMLIPLTAVPSDLIVAYTGGSLARRLSGNPKLRILLNCLGAVFLVLLGLRLFLA